MYLLEKNYDVLIVGGGPSGVMAAIGAARSGAKDVLLIEQDGELGGQLKYGLLIHGFFDQKGTQVVYGLADEFINRLRDKYGAAAHVEMKNHPNTAAAVCVDLEYYKLELMEMLLEDNVDVLLHTNYLDVLKKNKKVQGVIATSKSGKHIIPADITIDCTGDGDVAAGAGAEYKLGREKDGLTQNLTLIFTMENIDGERAVAAMKQSYGEGAHPNEEPFKMWWKGVLSPWAKQAQDENLYPPNIKVEKASFATNTFHPGRYNFNATAATQLVGTSVYDLTKAEICCRRQAVKYAQFLKKNIPGFESARLVATASGIGVRETRRIIGDYVLTYNDCLVSQTFSDVISLGGFFMDIHDPKGEEFLHTPEKGVHTKQQRAYHIPYRCLLPRGIEQILVAGRCISAEHEALASARVVASSMATGHAAGVAAGLSSKNQCQPRQISIKELQDTLQKQGAKLGY